MGTPCFCFHQLPRNPVRIGRPGSAQAYQSSLGKGIDAGLIENEIRFKGKNAKNILVDKIKALGIDHSGGKREISVEITLRNGKLLSKIMLKIKTSGLPFKIDAFPSLW